MFYEQVVVYGSNWRSCNLVFCTFSRKLPINLRRIQYGSNEKDCLAEEAYWRRHPEELHKVVDEDREDRAREWRSR